MRPTIQMFQLPSVIALSIAAARMYRSLTDFVSGVTHMYDIRVLTLLPFHLSLFVDGSIADLTMSTKATVKVQGHMGTRTHSMR